MCIIVIIPARSGSKSVVDKNITKLSGHPLLAYTIAAAIISKKIDRIIISTNSKKNMQKLQIIMAQRCHF